MKRPVSIFLLAVLIAVSASAVWQVVRLSADRSPQKYIADAEAELNDDSPEAAWNVVVSGIAEHRDNISLHTLAARIAEVRKDAQAELAQREWLAAKNAGNVDSDLRLAELYSQLEFMNLKGAEATLKSILKVAPNHAGAHDLMIRILNQEGRRWETLKHLRWQFEHDAFTLESLILAGNLSAGLPMQEIFLKKCANNDLDIRASLGVARMLFATGDSQRASEILTRITSEQPEIVEAQIRLAEIWQINDPPRFDDWDNENSPQFDGHPHLWLLRGKRATQSGDREKAIHCFARSCAIDPSRRDALFLLSQSLLQDGREAEASLLIQDYERLTELAGMVRILFEHGPAREEMERCAELTLELGRTIEANGWCRFILANSPDSKRAAKVLVAASAADTSSFMPTRLGNTIPDVYATQAFPGWKSAAPKVIPTTTDDVEAIFAFDAEPTETFPRFQYFNGAEAETQERRMFEFTGGGVAALDFDNDLYPDIFLVQGQHWSYTKPELHDRLYRNRRGTAFADTTDVSMPDESGFGQGVAASDIDSDGFEDLMVCNIGRNQLLRNNGDGTYSDVTPFPQQPEKQVWTSSAAFGDFDNDGDEDLYVGNFLGGDDVFTRVCGEDGVPHSCPPAGFPGEPDSLWLNNGDGTWKDISTSAGIIRERSNTLGIIVADFARSGRQSVFVANDSVANFYFRNISGDQIEFEERGLGVGLAFSQTGSTQACMGVAAGDFDGNQLLDLCVTNFHDEANAAYLQISEEVFIDSTREVGIFDHSLKLLGFGTQALDADLDGWQDLIVTNGHVDDFSADGIPFEMPPMFLRNLNGERFERLDFPDDSEFFNSPKLGRGLCRIDWNVDGLDDFCISHLMSASKLVTNRTKTENSYVAIRLFRNRGIRTTLGSHLTLTIDGQKQYGQAVSGHGYMAVNEQRFVFGCPASADRSDILVSVQWPGRDSVDYRLPPDGSEFAIVEGRGFYSLVR